MNMLDEAKRECKKLEKLKYDGVAGKLPSWVPEPIKKDFEIIRINLFIEAPTNYGPAEILRSYQEYEDFLDGKGLGSFPAQYHDKFDTLTRIRKGVRLGPKKGLSYWVGERVNKDIQRGKKILSSTKKGHVGSFGTKKQKKERYKKYQVKMNELHRQNKKLSYTELSKRVAKHFYSPNSIKSPKPHVNPRTIRNHTKNPHRKK